MENSSLPLYVTTIDAGVSNSSSLLSTSENVIPAQQNMANQPNVHLHDNSGHPIFSSTPIPQSLTQFQYPPPYFKPYDPTMQFSSMYAFNHSIHYSGSGMLNFEPQGSSQSNAEEKKRIAQFTRENRKKARQNRASGSWGYSEPEGIITDTRGESNLKTKVIQNRIAKVVCAPDGTKLQEILTKKLKYSDLSSLGRIILPKREAEENLPTLTNREGIDVVLKDVNSGLLWTLKYKYWVNNNSRMYVFDHVGDFVNHYELQMGDSLTLYEDTHKNLYVSIEKNRNSEEENSSSRRDGMQTQETSQNSYIYRPYTHQAKDEEEEEESLALLIQNLSHNGDSEATTNLFNM